MNKHIPSWACQYVSPPTWPPATGAPAVAAVAAVLLAAAAAAGEHAEPRREARPAWADALPADALSNSHFRVERLPNNPIIHPGTPGVEPEGGLGHNINGPSLIRVPDWIDNPLGRYYLYFAHHNGSYIRLAYADDLEGPWQMHEGGVLPLEDAPGRHHVASPDVHVDDDDRRIRMYFHQPTPHGSPYSGQRTWVALSEDGLRFEARDEVLGLFYFRVFAYEGWHYALAKYFNDGGIIYRSRDGLSDFEEGPRCLPDVRHTAVWVDRDTATLYVIYSLVEIEGIPEHLYISTADLTRDWREWEFTAPESLLWPEEDWEGANLPVETSRYGAVRGPVHELRDPAIYEEDGQLYLLYSVAGEQGIAIARLHPLD